MVFVRADDADIALEVLQQENPAAAIIGEVVAEHRGVVVAKTGIGGTRVVDLPLAEQLPGSADPSTRRVLQRCSDTLACLAVSQHSTFVSQAARTPSRPAVRSR